MEEIKKEYKQEFAQWVKTIKSEIRNAQIKAAVRVNSTLLHLYWNLGKEITERQKSASWGDGFLKELSRELMAEFPDMKGFSYTNIRYIKQWYLFYNQDNTICQQLVGKLGEEVFFSVPWGHHLYIMSSCKDINKAVFYLQKTVENGWSRAVLLNFLDTDLYERQGKAVNNFSRVLPDTQSDLAQQTLKDPYTFDFITLTDDYKERELEDALTGNISRFLIELGQGFAYVGRQVPLEVGDETLFADLLFYHLELRCYVVIELKACKFQPAFIGQLGTYVSAVNHLKKKPTDNTTIGLIVCKTKDDVMAQYALESTNQPIGITAYELSKLIPDEFKSKLPSIEEIENSVRNIEGDDKH
jgi:predicted nuclease of restriction endonuclease-like (RecB) superfamily